MTLTSSAHGTIPAEISRLWLLVSARDRNAFHAAAASLADQVILDLEDGVDPSLKDTARQDVVDGLAGGGRAWVRINDHATGFWNNAERAGRASRGASDTDVHPS